MSAPSETDHLGKSFVNIFGRAPEIYARAPGRINIIGEHIDYNHGYVMPVAIDKYITAAASRNSFPGYFRLHALDLGESYEWRAGEDTRNRPLWSSYIYGSICEWQVGSLDQAGIDLMFTGNIPTGAGISSSAALEAATALAIADLWGISLEKRDLALHCQKVEHLYVGVKCGIMDQYASIFGEQDKAILLDCLSITHRYLPLILDEYAFLLCNTGVTHSLASSGYNDRRESCELVFRKVKEFDPGIQTWRDVTLDHLHNLISTLKDKDYKRGIHVVREIERVKQAADALEKGNLGALGHFMYQSHEDLSQNYEVSCPELDFLVEQAKMEASILGARMMGGGFGGCTINLIPIRMVDQFISEISRKYRDRFGLELESYLVRSGNGAHLF